MIGGSAMVACIIHASIQLVGYTSFCFRVSYNMSCVPVFKFLTALSGSSDFSEHCQVIVNSYHISSSVNMRVSYLELTIRVVNSDLLYSTYYVVPDVEAYAGSSVPCYRKRRSHPLRGISPEACCVTSPTPLEQSVWLTLQWRSWYSPH